MKYCSTVLEYSSTQVRMLVLENIKQSGQKDPSPCERSELTSLRVRHYRPRRAAGSPSAQRYTPLAPHIIDTALGSPLAPHPAGNSIKYRNYCVGLEEVGRRLTDCSYYQPPPNALTDFESLFLKTAAIKNSATGYKYTK